MNATELKAWIQEQKLQAYEFAHMLARGDLDYKAAGYSRAKNAAEAAALSILATAKRIEQKIQAYEKANP